MKTYVCTYFAGTRIICTELPRKSDGERVQVTYYAYDDGSHFGSEVYSGKNYVLGSTKPSYSRNYKSFKHLPKEWKPIVFDLVEKAGKVKWSTFVGKGHTFEA